MRYPGGKGGAGVYQTIINMMPPHRVYIETHVGGGNILERKRPALASIVIDADGGVIQHYRNRAGITAIHGDAAGFLRTYPFQGDELIYADPPYVMSSRRGGRLYRHEYTDEQHQDLLSLLLTVQASVMVSGYRNALYDKALHDWQRVDFQAMTRQGPAVESLWMNFEPAALHDYSYLGSNFRERERIKRKQSRWRTRLAGLPSLERQAMLRVLLELESPEMAIAAAPAISSDAGSG